MAAWLRRHPGVEIVARNRAGVDGARAGAPHARQVADRWHVLRNMGDALRSVVKRYHAVVRRIAQQVADEMAAKPRAAPVEAPRPAGPERRKRAAFARRPARYEQAERLLADGLPLRDAAVRLGVDPRTLRRWRELGHTPLWDRRLGGSILDPFRGTSSTAGPMGAATPASSGASWLGSASPAARASCGSGRDSGARWTRPPATTRSAALSRLSMSRCSSRPSS